MPIDTEIKIRGYFFQRWLSVGELEKILTRLEEDDLLFPNQVGNLSIVRDGEYIGFIDFDADDLKTADDF